MPPASLTAAINEKRRLYLDLVHLGRHVTGLERISIELFDRMDVPGVEVHRVRAAGMLERIVKQQIVLPALALRHRQSVFAFPGFPPSIAFALAPERTLFYVHDLFLMQRWSELNLTAKLYMALPFRIAVAKLKYFLVNSEKTGAELAEVARSDAVIQTYRPLASNVFGVSSLDRASRPEHVSPLRLVMIGTVEPRKNYGAAVKLREALEARLGVSCELHIVGRPGWGGVTSSLEGLGGVHLHGYLSADATRTVLEQADVYLSTSHDEGLGLGLLEAQFAGLPVVAPDKPVFREVLAGSGTYINTDDIPAAAEHINHVFGQTGWRVRAVGEAAANIQRWSALATTDRGRVESLVMKLTGAS